MRSIRGAVGIEQNTKESILSNTSQLLKQILDENQLSVDDICTIIFSATADLTAAYPAIAARDLGIFDASLLCVQEMPVENSMSMCIRVLMTVNKEGCQKDSKHVYINGAEGLRPDLSKK
ncbi:MAG: chorismate mutase [Vallitaleaceae bacterium]|nr:chorismate mutase [Vallitaleaceae bacterium]